MEKYEIVLLILSDIIENNIPFSISTKKAYQSESVSREDRPLISGLVGCELRHHLVLMDIAKRTFGLQGEFNALPVLVALANGKYYKKFDQKQLNKYACDKLDIKSSDLESCLNDLEAKEDIIPEEYERGSFNYLSLRFNTPLWLVKLWVKHYGRGLAYKILKSNYRMPTHFYSLNGVDEETVLKDSEHFAATNVKGLVKLLGSSKQVQLIQSNNLIEQMSAMKDVINKIEIPAFSNVAIYSAYPNNLYLDIALNNPKSKIDLVNDNVQLFSDCKRNIGAFGLKNVQIYEAKTNALITCISEKVETFFVMPNNSMFHNFKTSPDYFHIFSRDSLDQIIKEEAFALDEASTLVNNGGQLIYLVPTLNKKETLQIVKEFLLTHPTYSVIEEKQYYPFDEHECSLYYVKFINLNREND